MSSEIALTPDHAEHLDFQEDHDMLKILRTKLFRWAIERNVKLSQQMPAIGDELAADLDGMWDDLDEARDGKDAVTREIKKWREELTAA
jgi:hypothetical protein